MKTDIAVGALLLISSVIGLVTVRVRPDKLVCLSQKQATIFALIGLAGGALILGLSLYGKP
jgi:hypothetical protein